ncbi:hypothetical protein MOQ_009774 [Trypanosoma cruzi marinkellei]|uniref:Uncharacterized protein n=1 Tax=Trypanosoma cruzi marinkellei TaxID=85056 RepID=K2MHC9_TRYCR|nr:hypothetical protein MOQ_009774 [Trypanosoma cruzi marinkellei]
MGNYVLFRGRSGSVDARIERNACAPEGVGRKISLCVCVCVYRRVRIEKEIKDEEEGVDPKEKKNKNKNKRRRKEDDDECSRVLFSFYFILFYFYFLMFFCCCFPLFVLHLSAYSIQIHTCMHAYMPSLHPTPPFSLFLLHYLLFSVPFFSFLGGLQTSPHFPLPHPFSFYFPPFIGLFTVFLCVFFFLLWVIERGKKKKGKKRERKKGRCCVFFFLSSFVGHMTTDHTTHTPLAVKVTEHSFFFLFFFPVLHSLFFFCV